jgi:hypothetical protein
VALVRDVSLLDLASDWPTRAGGSQAVSSGPRPTAQNWSRAIHEDLGADGLAYPSSMKGRGTNVALYERAQDALAATPRINFPLDHPAPEIPLLRVATGFAFGIAC